MFDGVPTNDSANMTQIIRFRALATACIALVAGSAAATTPDSSQYLTRPGVIAFIEEMHVEHGLDPDEVRRVLGSVQHQPRVVRLIGPERPASAPPVVRSWPAYRARFLDRARIAAGVKYWAEHELTLQLAEATYGVPVEVILGILGVETLYGANTGSFRVVDALATIAFDGPRRQEYFRGELRELLLMARDTGIDPLTLRGSYAGAMGLPQFMPSSFRRWAVDFDGDGRIDLAGTPADAIGSIAHYLQAHGWVPRQPAYVPVELPAGAASRLVTGLARTSTVADLRAEGAVFRQADLPETECSVVELPTPGKPARYVAGFANFEAVTRYNRSTFYAMAVLELAEAIRTARGRQLAAAAQPGGEPGPG